MPAESLNLIRVFDFYLALMFVISLVRRWEVYWSAIRIMLAVRGRWPRLVQRLAEHQSLLLNWSFFRPVVLALLLTVVQMVCSRLIRPDAVLLGSDLENEWWKLAVILAPLAFMLGIGWYVSKRMKNFDDFFIAGRTMTTRSEEHTSELSHTVLSRMPSSA